MEFLNWTLYENTAHAWILAALVGAAVVAGLELLKSLLIRYLSALAKRAGRELEGLGARMLGETKFFFLVFVGIYAGVQFVALPEIVDEWVARFVLFALLIQIGIWGSVIITYFLVRYNEAPPDEREISETKVQFISFVGRLALWLLLVLVAIDNLGFDITALIAGLGVAGIAIAFALQKVLGDLLASLSIVLDRPFDVGDFVVVGQESGTVEHVGVLSTRVRSISGEQIVFPNNDLLSNRVRNYARMQERRIVFSFGVTFDTPAAKLEAIPPLVREVVEAQEQTRFDRAHFKQLGASSLDFEVVYFVLDPDYTLYMDIQQAINLELFRRFEERGIEFAFPTRTVMVRPSEAEAGAAAAAAG